MWCYNAGQFHLEIENIESDLTQGLLMARGAGVRALNTQDELSRLDD